MFLDARYDAAYHYYLNRYRALPSPVRDENFKGRLQQVAQERFGETPVYDSEGARVRNRREYAPELFAWAHRTDLNSRGLLTLAQSLSHNDRAEEHTSELESRPDFFSALLL